MPPLTLVILSQRLKPAKSLATQVYSLGRQRLNAQNSHDM